MGIVYYCLRDPAVATSEAPEAFFAPEFVGTDFFDVYHLLISEIEEVPHFVGV